MSRRFTFSLLLFSLLHCGDPPGGETPPPTVDEAPCAKNGKPGLTAKSRFPEGSKSGHANPFAASVRSQARAARISDPAWIRQPTDARQKVRIGDFVLVNDKIAAYIEDTGVSDGYQEIGGEILGLDTVGSDGFPRGASQYGETIVAFSRQAVTPDSVTVLKDGSDGGEAVVRVSGKLGDMPFLTEGFGAILNQVYDLPAALDYVLAPGAERIVLKLSLMNPTGEVADISSLQGVGFFHSARSQRFTPEAGYADPQGTAEFVAFDNPGASFAFRWLGGPLAYTISQSGFEMYRMSGLKLESCEEKSLDYIEWTVAGPGIDDLLTSLRRGKNDTTFRKISGTVKQAGGKPVAGAYVHVKNSKGRYFTRALTDENGAYSLHAPGEMVELVVTQSGYAMSTPKPLPPTDSTADLTVPDSGFLVVHVREPLTKTPLPARIQVIPDDKVEKIPDQLGVRQERNGRAVVEFTVDGEARIELRPGQHRVLVSRGLEWEIVDQTLKITAGSDTELNAELAHSVDTTGVMCADFHIHSNYSADSDDPVPLKVKSAIADGVDIPVSSEHEWIHDFQPTIKQLGMTRWAYGFPSEEFTTFTWGHFGVIPKRQDLEQVNNGAVQWIGKQPPQVFHDIAQLPERPVLIVNHPRGGLIGGYFEAADYNRATGTGDPILWSSEFEAVEAFNDSDLDSNRAQTVADWFSLLNHGKRIWAVGSSDSHGIVSSPVGYPRTCLRFGHDDPTQLTPELVRNVLRAGQATVSGGLYLTVAGPGGVGPGGGVASPSDPLTFQIVVQSPKWLAAKQLEVIVNGETERTVELTETVTGGPGRRYDATVTLTRGARPQSWVVFHAKADGRDLSPIYPGRKPFGVSNPVFF